VSFYDVPIGLALLGRLRLGRWLLAAGPRVALHLLTAEAMAMDGRTGSRVAPSAGLGAVAQARLAIVDAVAVALTVGGEALVPEQRFTVDGGPAASPGAFTFAASLGLVVRLF
jgi:hypothetical protein